MAGLAAAQREIGPDSLTGRLGQTDAILQECEEILFAVFDALDGPTQQTAQNEPPVAPGVSVRLMSLSARSLRIRDRLNDLVNRIR